VHDLLEPGVHLYADQAGQGLRDPERAPEHEAWTAPRTWVVSEVVTASIMNVHVRDNFTFVYNQALNGQVIVGDYYGPGPTVDNVTRALTNQVGLANWLDLSNQGGTPKIRIVMGWHVNAVNGCTNLGYAGARACELDSTGGHTIAFADIGAGGNYTPVVGWGSYDSGWVTRSSAPNWELLQPAARFAVGGGGTPGIDLLQASIMVRVI
jgi:hypothetical protein